MHILDESLNIWVVRPIEYKFTREELPVWKFVPKPLHEVYKALVFVIHLVDGSDVWLHRGFVIEMYLSSLSVVHDLVSDVTLLLSVRTRGVVDNVGNDIIFLVYVTVE